MAILKYVPPTKKIIDNRNPDGGYYVAKCEVCETEFYPQRSNAMYCSPNCGLIAHRIAVADGTAKKREVSKPKKKEEAPMKEVEVKEKSGKVIKGRNNVYKYLKTKFNTRGDREKILTALDAIKTGEDFTYNKAKIKKTSALKFEVV